MSRLERFPTFSEDDIEAIRQGLQAAGVERGPADAIEEARAVFGIIEDRHTRRVWIRLVVAYTAKLERNERMERKWGERRLLAEQKRAARFARKGILRERRPEPPSNVIELSAYRRARWELRLV